MNTTELKNLFVDAGNINGFANINATLHFFHTEESATFIGILPIFEFLNQQIQGWNTFENNIPEHFKNSKKYLNDLKASITDFIKQYLSMDETQIGSRWNEFYQRWQNNHNYPIFRFDHPDTLFLLKTHQRNQGTYIGAYNFLNEHPNWAYQHNNSINDNNYLTGVILAYEYKFRDSSLIVSRRDSEKASFSTLRSNFQKYLNESEKQLASFLSESLDKSKSLSLELDELKKSKEKLVNEWFDKSKYDFSDFHNGSIKKISELEKTYDELLRLKKPAEYWKTRATELKKEAWKMLYWLIGLVTFGCITLYLLLWLTPEGMLLSFIKGDASAIKWSIIYVTFISFLAYGIKAIHKVVFSTFHLARDAEEREHLTFVYLAMVKDTTIKDEDRQLIMQSLFSRADTGLLKEDSSPTMPGVADKIFRN